jgi:mono/diheme cytochrome c family protein
VRRLAPLLVLALLAAGCSDSKPGGKVVSPVPGSRLVVVKAPKGDPTAGKGLFTANGCGACHTYKVAASTGKVGPDLDKLPQYATQANRGSLQAFVSESITAPDAYVQPGYPAHVMPAFSSLTAKQVADLVAFLTQGH